MRSWIVGSVMVISTAAYAAPAIHVGQMFEYMDGNKSTLLKRVQNAGDSAAFVKVSVVEMVYGDKDEPEEKPVEMEGLAQGGLDGLVASPARLIIPAKGMQAARLLHMGARDQERYYRVRFVPVLPEKQDQFEVSEAEAEQYKQQMSAGVQVLAGYGIIAIVRPQQPVYDTQLEEQAAQFIVHNRGNSTIVLDSLYTCDAKLKNCANPIKVHVRPGSQKRFPQESGRSYQFELVEGEKKREIRFGAISKD